MIDYENFPKIQYLKLALEIRDEIGTHLRIFQGILQIEGSSRVRGGLSYYPILVSFLWLNICLSFLNCF